MERKGIKEKIRKELRIKSDLKTKALNFIKKVKMNHANKFKVFFKFSVL